MSVDAELASELLVDARKVYFAVEFAYVHSRRIRVNPQETNSVPVYLCCFGGGADAEIQEEGCFVVTDDHERLWFCREVTQPDPAQPGFAQQFFRMGYLAHKIGINEGGIMFHGNAENEEDLRDKLNDQQQPDYRALNRQRSICRCSAIQQFVGR